MSLLPRASLSRAIVIAAALLALLTLCHFRSALHNAYAIIRMPLVWRREAPAFLIAEADLDLSFAAYNRSQDSFAPDYPDRVPPILHHIALGSAPPNPAWVGARDACLALHPGWQPLLWTDENAADFVQDAFPELWDLWRGYKYPIQRIDALRYMVLYHYGGGHAVFLLPENVRL
jgi:mannosyltransferase OCH1-like enzyme